MAEHKNHHSMLSFSDLIQKTFHLIEKHFLEFLFAVAVPIFIAYVMLWVGSSVFVTDFNSVQNFSDLAALFSFENRTLGIVILSLVITGFANIIGLIAVPLVAIEHETITMKKIFPRTLRYFGSYVVMLILIGIGLLLLLILAHLLLFIVSIVLALIDINLLNTWSADIELWITNISLGLGILFITFAPFYLIEKKSGAWQALKHSVLLVGNHFWGILIRAALGLVGIVLIVFVLQFIPIIGGPLGIIVGALLLTPYHYIMYKDVS